MFDKNNNLPAEVNAEYRASLAETNQMLDEALDAETGAELLNHSTPGLTGAALDAALAEETDHIQLLKSVDRMKQEAVRLLTGFQCALLDLPIAIQTIESEQEKEDAQFILGVCTMNASNCEALLEEAPESVVQRRLEFAKFLQESGDFLASLQAQGFGHTPKNGVPA